MSKGKGLGPSIRAYSLRAKLVIVKQSVILSILKTMWMALYAKGFAWLSVQCSLSHANPGMFGSEPAPVKKWRHYQETYHIINLLQIKEKHGKSSYDFYGNFKIKSLKHPHEI